MKKRSQYDQASTTFLEPGEKPPPVMVTLPDGTQITQEEFEAIPDLDAFLANLENSNPEDIT